MIRYKSMVEVGPPKPSQLDENNELVYSRFFKEHGFEDGLPNTIVDEKVVGKPGLTKEIEDAAHHGLDTHWYCPVTIVLHKDGKREVLPKLELRAPYHIKKGESNQGKYYSLRKEGGLVAFYRDGEIEFFDVCPVDVMMAFCSEVYGL